MRIVKVKICGITNLEDAKAAVDMGADILGFNFYPKSPRYILPDKALEIINQLPTFVDTAAVLVDALFDQVKDLAELGFLNWLQFHGNETPEYCDAFKWFNIKTIKAIRVASEDYAEQAKTYYTDAILLDAFDKSLYGGTGKKFDWSLLTNINKRIFLAGGINPENSVEAVETGVYGIDICSGVEESPGKKDHSKMKKLFENLEHVRG
ncbi:MAG: phosphoribosylanthranilate isomerase [Sedimentisphaerales bacterium]|nr:phosphoribosylanthranilate isomerase [Sedimentisphaerales bacterium]